MRVLVLGGYGLIGLALVRALHAAGHDVVGLGRSAALGRRLFPRVTWCSADIATLQHPAAWRSLLDGVEVVVNAAPVTVSTPVNSARWQRAASSAKSATPELGDTPRFQDLAPPTESL